MCVCVHDIMVMLSGCLPSAFDMPLGSSIASTFSMAKARRMTLLSAACRELRPTLYECFVAQVNEGETCSQLFPPGLRFQSDTA